MLQQYAAASADLLTLPDGVDDAISTEQTVITPKMRLDKFVSRIDKLRIAKKDFYTHIRSSDAESISYVNDGLYYAERFLKRRRDRTLRVVKKIKTFFRYELHRSYAEAIRIKFHSAPKPDQQIFNQYWKALRKTIMALDAIIVNDFGGDA